MKNQLLNLVHSKIYRNQGQSMVEYMLIISLISIAVITVLLNFSDVLLDFYRTVRDALPNF